MKELERLLIDFIATGAVAVIALLVGFWICKSLGA